MRTCASTPRFAESIECYGVAILLGRIITTRLDRKLSGWCIFVAAISDPPQFDRRKDVRSADLLDVRHVRHLIIAGWTERDRNALEKHIRELEAIGVKRPKSTPIFYRVAASLLTTDDTIEMLGDHSSGEAECVAYAFEDGTRIGLGSDHTDRKAEIVGVSLSKQMCAKPVSRDLWAIG